MTEWEHFKSEEFQCSCCETNEMDVGVITELDSMRELLGFPLIVTSGYRCVLHPAEISKETETGPHTTGLAADIALSHIQADLFLELAYQRGFFTGKGISQKGKQRFIHVDKCPSIEGRPRRHLWSY